MRFHALITLPRVALLTLAVLWTAVPSTADAASFPSHKPTIEQVLSGPAVLEASKTRRAPKSTSRPAPRAPSRPAPRAAPARQKTTADDGRGAVAGRIERTLDPQPQRSRRDRRGRARHACLEQPAHLDLAATVRAAVEVAIELEHRGRLELPVDVGVEARARELAVHQRRLPVR
jgi:hypothetical protein